MLVDRFKRFDQAPPLVLGRDVDRLAEVSAQRLLDHLRAGVVLHRARPLHHLVQLLRERHRDLPNGHIDLVGYEGIIPRTRDGETPTQWRPRRRPESPRKVQPPVTRVRFTSYR